MPPTAIPYAIPTRWIHYDATAIVQNFVDAKAAVLSLRATPHQRDWVEKRQKLQLKMEVAGTSRIEGADFTERELDAALDIGKKAEDLATRSQRQARAAAETYRWIATIPYDHPITEDLVLDIHRRLVIDCDDDHCPPGRLRVQDENVTFGFPRHRGCAGGPPGTILIENPPICPHLPISFCCREKCSCSSNCETRASTSTLSCKTSSHANRGSSVQVARTVADHEVWKSNVPRNRQCQIHCMPRPSSGANRGSSVQVARTVADHTRLRIRPIRPAPEVAG